MSIFSGLGNMKGSGISFLGIFIVSLYFFSNTTISAASTTALGKYTFTVGGIPTITLDNITKAVAITNCASDKKKYPAKSKSCRWIENPPTVNTGNTQGTGSSQKTNTGTNGNAKSNITSNVQGTSSSASTTQATTGLYKGYMGGSSTPFITTQSISKNEAYSNCKTNSTNNPTKSIRCTWNGDEIYLYSPTISSSPTISILVDFDGHSFLQGDNIDILWSGSNISKSAAIAIWLVNSETNKPFGIIKRGEAANGSITWTIPKPNSGVNCPDCGGIQSTPPAGAYKIVIKAYTPFNAWFGDTYPPANPSQPTYIASVESKSFKITKPEMECPVYSLSHPAAGCDYTYTKNANGCDIPKLVCTTNTEAVTGLYKGYLGGSSIPFITTEKISKDEAYNNCKLNSSNNPTKSIRCTWNSVEIYSYSPPVSVPEESKEVVTCLFTGATLGESNCTTYVENKQYSCSGKYSCSVAVYGKKGTKLTWKSSLGGYGYTTIDFQDETVVFTGIQNISTATLTIQNGDTIKKEVGVTKEVALTICKDHGTTKAVKCTWNDEVIYTYSPTATQGTNTNNTTTSVTTGLYKGYLGGSETPFITTEKISKDEAYNNCKLNSSNNPTKSIRCTWNNEVIFTYTPPTVPSYTQTEINSALSQIGTPNIMSIATTIQKLNSAGKKVSDEKMKNAILLFNEYLNSNQ